MFGSKTKKMATLIQQRCFKMDTCSLKEVKEDETT